MRHLISAVFCISFTLMCIGSSANAETNSAWPCQLEEARSVACAAAVKSYQLSSNLEKAEGVFKKCMEFYNCQELRYWRSVCGQ